MPTKIYLIPSKESEKYLKEYLAKHSIQPPKRIHSTITYNIKSSIFPRKEIISKIKDLFPIILNPKTYLLDFSGEERTITLRYKNGEVTMINRIVLEEVLRQMMIKESNLSKENLQVLKDYDKRKVPSTFLEFNPYITISDSLQEKINVNNLRTPEKPITLDRLLWAM